MLTFGITTTTKMASLCLFDDIKGVLCEISAEVSKTHSTTIIDQIDKMLEWSGKSLEDIDNVIVSVGPGSFTGVRIAIATVKGMFHGRDVSIFEVNELEALAYQSVSVLNTLTDKKIISMIDSNKEKIYQYDPLGLCEFIIYGSAKHSFDEFPLHSAARQMPSISKHS